MKGFLCVNKPKGVTSFDVVAAVRRLCGVRRVGHAGTLDRLATGVLVIGVGEGTKLLEFLMKEEKEYEFSARFGAVSSTGDADGKIVECAGAQEVSLDQIESCVAERFLGDILQRPPRYSAVKIAGRRASDIVRGGGKVELRPRNVHIFEYEVSSLRWPQWSGRVRCSSGTYIRSLVADIGGVLQVGAYTLELQRTRSGRFFLSQCVNFDDLDKNIDQKLLSIEAVFSEYPRLDISAEDCQVLLHGAPLLNQKIDQTQWRSPVMAFCEGRLVAVLELASGGGVKACKIIH